VEFAQEASIIGSVEEVAERRKDVIRACQREEWHELLTPLCNGKMNRVQAALTSHDDYYACPLPAILAAGATSSSSSSSSPAPTTPSSSPVSLSPPEHATASSSPEQQQQPPSHCCVGFSFPPAPLHAQPSSAYLPQESTAYANCQLPNAGAAAPPPLSPLFPVPADMYPLPSFSAFLDQPDLPSWLD
jgi:hypothetical protein